MGWKVLVVTGSVLVAALGVASWVVAASVTPPSPVIGPRIVVTAAAPDLPVSGPQGLFGSPNKGAPLPDPTPRALASPSAAPAPPVTGSRDTEALETVNPRRVRPVENDLQEHAKYDGNAPEVDDD
jgi:hypothetical protein